MSKHSKGFGGGQRPRGSSFGGQQESLGDEEVTISSGGGAVTVVVNGHRTVKSIAIKPEAVDPNDVEMLQDLLLSALNEALTKVKDMEDERMGGLTQGLGLPPGLL
jgi:DNA-binding YbaB/EbfC family protein